MDEQLALAARHRVAVEYWDQGGSHHGVAPDTVVAVLAALGVAADHRGVAGGWRRRRRRPARLATHPAAGLRGPAGRAARIWVHVPHGLAVSGAGRPGGRQHHGRRSSWIIWSNRVTSTAP